MEFRTSIPISIVEEKISHQSKLLMLGSCFSENIGNKFQYFKFDAIVNPFGIIFNAISLENIINRIVSKKYFTSNDVFFHNELWQSFEVHSSCSEIYQEDFIQKLNDLIDELNLKIKEITHCLITFGTSWVYKHKDSNEIVANCHKVPQNQFEKLLLTPNQIFDAIIRIENLLKSINPSIKLVFTISPVRHIKDGFFENNISKGNLFSALQEFSLVSKLNYFPSYEIVMDELRDYRFFEKDMLHPNQLAIDYIWEKFGDAFFLEETKQLNAEIDAVQKAMLHRSFNPNTEKHQVFLKQLQEKIEKLKLKNIKF